MDELDVGTLPRSKSANPIFSENKLKLGVFGLNGKGSANTLAPEAHRPDWKRILRAATLADDMRLEVIFAYSRWKSQVPGKIEHPSGTVLDPFTWAAGVAQATGYSALIATAHAPTLHPVTAAKMCATVDVISAGRFGLNIVAGWNQPELEMFGAPMKEHDRRYDHLAEWLEIMKRLWTADEELDFEGEFFKVIKAMSRPKPVQRPHPPIINAGSSGRGRDLAMEVADMCFISIRAEDLIGRRAQVDEYKKTAREKYGRDVQVWTMCNIFQRDTQRDAEDFLRRIAIEYGDYESVAAKTAQLDANSKPLTRIEAETRRMRSAAGAGGSILLGDAETVTEQLQGFADAGVDGLLIGFVDFADGLERLRAGVLPRLEERGLRVRPRS